MVSHTKNLGDFANTLITGVNTKTVNHIVKLNTGINAKADVKIEDEIDDKDGNELDYEGFDRLNI